MFKKDLSLEEIKTYNHFITDGNIYIVYLILLNYAPYIINLYIDKRYLAINSWLVWKCKNYYQDLGINYEINLDTSINMLSYQQFSNIVIVGDNGFITGIKKDFPKGIFKIMEIN